MVAANNALAQAEREGYTGIFGPLDVMYVKARCLLEFSQNESAQLIFEQIRNLATTWQQFVWVYISESFIARDLALSGSTTAALDIVRAERERAEVMAFNNGLSVYCDLTELFIRYTMSDWNRVGILLGRLPNFLLVDRVRPIYELAVGKTPSTYNVENLPSRTPKEEIYKYMAEADENIDRESVALDYMRKALEVGARVGAKETFLRQDDRILNLIIGIAGDVPPLTGVEQPCRSSILPVGYLFQRAFTTTNTSLRRHEGERRFGGDREAAFVACGGSNRQRTEIDAARGVREFHDQCAGIVSGCDFHRDGGDSVTTLKCDQFDGHRVGQPPVALQSQRHFQAMPWRGDERGASKLDRESPRIDKGDHLVVLVVGAVADRVLAAVGIRHDARHAECRATGPSDLHPRRQHHGKFKVALPGGDSDWRRGDALQVPSLTVGHTHFERSLEAVSFHPIFADEDRSTGNELRLENADELEGCGRDHRQPERITFDGRRRDSGGRCDLVDFRRSNEFTIADFGTPDDLDRDCRDASVGLHFERKLRVLLIRRDHYGSGD